MQRGREHLGSTRTPQGGEAKKLGEKLEHHLPQMVTYATMAGIPYCGLTDGNIWILHDVFHMHATGVSSQLFACVPN